MINIRSKLTKSFKPKSITIPEKFNADKLTKEMDKTLERARENLFLSEMFATEIIFKDAVFYAFRLTDQQNDELDYLMRYFSRIDDRLHLQFALESTIFEPGTHIYNRINAFSDIIEIFCDEVGLQLDDQGGFINDKVINTDFYELVSDSLGIFLSNVLTFHESLFNLRGKYFTNLLGRSKEDAFFYFFPYFLEGYIQFIAFKLDDDLDEGEIYEAFLNGY